MNDARDTNHPSESPCHEALQTVLAMLAYLFGDPPRLWRGGIASATTLRVFLRLIREAEWLLRQEVLRRAVALALSLPIAAVRGRHAHRRARGFADEPQGDASAWRVSFRMAPRAARPPESPHATRTPRRRGPQSDGALLAPLDAPVRDVWFEAMMERTSAWACARRYEAALRAAANPEKPARRLALRIRAKRRLARQLLSRFVSTRARPDFAHDAHWRRCCEDGLRAPYFNSA